MLDLNQPAEDTHVISCTSILKWNFQSHKIALLKNFNVVDLIVPFPNGNDISSCVFNDLVIEHFNSCSPPLFRFFQATRNRIFSNYLRNCGCR